MVLCRGGQIRTDDLQHPMLARYLATLHPDFNFSTYNLRTNKFPDLKYPYAQYLAEFIPISRGYNP